MKKYALKIALPILVIFTLLLTACSGMGGGDSTTSSGTTSATSSTSSTSSTTTSTATSSTTKPVVDFLFKANEDGTATIEGFVYREGLENVVIPSFVQAEDASELAVTAIAAEAFKDVEGVESVTIPASIVFIGENAFSGCSATEIYCEALSMPNAWDSAWNPDDIAVVWGYGHIHTLTHFEAKAPTCETAGELEYWLCEECEKMFSDELATVEIESIAGDPATGEHAFADGVCTDCGESEFFTFTLNADGESYTLSGKKTNAITELVVPSHYKGLPVTVIGASVFKSSLSLTKLTLPATVEVIQSMAFQGCFKLQEIAFANGGALKTIESNAFASCYALEKLVLPEGLLEVGSSAFNACSALSSVTLPSTLTVISGQAFYGCKRLVVVINHSSLNITAGSSTHGYVAEKAIEVLTEGGNTAQKQGDFYFYTTADGTTYLFSYGGVSSETITLPDTFDGADYILRASVFSGLNMKNVVVGSGVIAFEPYAFSDCKSLVSITFAPNSRLKTISEQTFRNDSKLLSIAIPASVTEIGKEAFYGCKVLKNVTFEPASQLQTIGEKVFKECRALVGITIPKNVEHIGESAFALCTALAQLSFEEGSALKTIEQQAFDECSAIKGALVIPAQVEKIQSYAFRKCSSLTALDIPASVTLIGQQAFSGCSGIATLTFAENGALKTIGSSAFSSCSSIKQVVVPNTVTTLYPSVFQWCNSLESLTIPFIGKTKTDAIASTAHLGSLFGSTVSRENAGYVPRTLKTVKVTSTSSIPKYAFYNCSSITTIEFLASVTTIKEGTFYGCAALTSFTLAANTGSIGKGAFSGSGLTSIVIPDTVTLIDEAAFSSCLNLVSVAISENSALTKIGMTAFQNCASLAEIYLPATLTNIGMYAFSECPSLESATFAQGCAITSLSPCLFENCTSLKQVTIPASVTLLGESAFSGCIALETIFIPASVTKTGSKLFFGCTNLTVLCEASHKVAGWDNNWNKVDEDGNVCSVQWGSTPPVQ